MDKHTSDALRRASSQIVMAAEALKCLRWAIDRTLMNEDFDGFIAIARIVLPTARTAMETTEPSSASDHVRVALDAIAYVERETDPTIPWPDFDRLVVIADPSIERAERAIEAALAVLRAPVRSVVLANRESLRRRSAQRIEVTR